MRNNPKRLGVLFILFAIPVTLSLIYVTQIFHNRAAEPVADSELNEDQQEQLEPQYVPGEVIVKFNATLNISNNAAKSNGVMQIEEKPPQLLSQINQTHPIGSIQQLFVSPNDSRSTQAQPSGNLANVYLIKFGEEEPILQVVEEFKKLPEVVYAQPNFIVKALFTPNDPEYSKQWSLNNTGQNGGKPGADINAPEAWDITQGISDIVVAVIDTGVDCGNQDLAGKCVAGYDFFNDDSDPLDDYGHGTEVASVIASGINDNFGIAGVAPEVKIMPLKILNDRGEGFSSASAAAITFAAEKGARVINMSYGFENWESPVEKSAVEYAASRGVVMVAGAGNHHNDVKTMIPASYKEVISVGATDQSDLVWPSSNMGGTLDVVAPGDDVFLIGGLISSGTSFSAPHVAGLAGLLLSVDPSLNRNEIRNIIINSAKDLGDPGFDSDYGYGRIDAEKALKERNASDPRKAFLEPMSFLQGENVRIYGSAFGPVFLDYKLEYSSDVQNWTKVGVNLENAGLTPVSDNLLGSIAFPDHGVYFVKLSVNYKEIVLSTEPITVVVGNVLPGFPVKNGTRFGSDASWVERFTVADVNEDNKLETIYFQDDDTTINVIDSAGKPLSNWPQKLPLGERTGIKSDQLGYSSGALVGDFDRDYPGKEIILPFNDISNEYVKSATHSTGCTVVKLYSFHADGSPIPRVSYPQLPEINPYSSFHLVKLQDEIGLLVIEKEIYHTFKEEAHPGLEMHLYRANGLEFEGWPQIRESDEIGNVALADLDNDGSEEIILTYIQNGDPEMRILNSKGEVIKSNAIDGLRYPDSDSFESKGSLLITDFERDGNAEIVVTTLSAKGQAVYVWDNEGKLTSPNLPIYLINDPSFTPRDSFTFLTTGTFDKSAGVEILVGLKMNSSVRYYLLNKQAVIQDSGESNDWPEFSLNDLPNATLNSQENFIAQIDRKVVGRDSQIRKYSQRMTLVGSVYDGSLGLKRKFEIPLAYNQERLYGNNFQYEHKPFHSTAPYIADINGDSKLEVIFNLGLNWNGINNYLYAINLDEISLDSAGADWPQYMHDERHTGAFVPANGLSEWYKGCNTKNLCVETNIPGMKPCTTDLSCQSFDLHENTPTNQITISTESLPEGQSTKYYNASIKATSTDPTATLSMKVQYQAVPLPNQTKRVPIADGLPKNMRLQPCKVTPGAIECPIVGQVAFGSKNDYSITVTVSDTNGINTSTIIPLKITR